ncbi:MAG: arginine deiminase [Spirochaetales bacterium]|nr:arginine deiminase [Spirochaetales bacterium]
MVNTTPLAVRSEIGPLRKVLLHKPGRELETLTPDSLEELLFDDIPWVERMQEEHDEFAQALRTRGCEVFYYRDLLVDVLSNTETRDGIVDGYLRDRRIPDARLRSDIRHLLLEASAGELADILIGGLRKEDVPHTEDEKRLSYYIKDSFPFYVNPLPNLYFTRDPGAMIGEGLAVNAMRTQARARESAILDILRVHHPLFAGNREHQWYSPEDQDSIEGGDTLVLGNGVVAVGCGSRTSGEAIETLASRLFATDSGFREVLVVQIPAVRAYMHLDTVFTMLSHDQFTIFPGIENELKVFRLTPAPHQGLRIEPLDCLAGALKKSLGIPAVQLIQSGGGDRITAAREQWNDSTNTLALAPGVVVTYRRNRYSNETLRQHGIEVVEIDGSELLRGRGGPRCMSMPLERAPLS